MPLYEYVCQACQEQFELLVRGDEQAACPQCGSGQLTKLLSVVAAPARSSAGGPGEDQLGPCGQSCCGCPYGD
jgi:putative FmdB family regulatory protein